MTTGGVPQRPLTTLPPGYEPRGSLDLSKQVPALIGMTVAGLALFVAFGAGFAQLASWLRPEVNSTSALELELQGVEVLWLLVVVAAVVVLHELAHGLCFWLFTRDLPEFGFKGVYAYAGAPRWYIPRDKYLVVGMAPLVGLSLVGAALMPFVPLGLLPLLLLGLTLNAAGAVGDLFVVAWLLTKPSSTLVRDTGDAFALYGPEQ